MFNLHRLDFEEIHDSILAIAGTLDLSTIGGRSVQLGSAQFATRRALYTYIDRRNPPELFTQFDFPSPSVPTGRRFVTAVPVGPNAGASRPRAQAQALTPAQAQPSTPGQAMMAEAQPRTGPNPLRKKAPQPIPGGAHYRGKAPAALDAWTKLAHALFQTNEAIMVN